MRDLLLYRLLEATPVDPEAVMPLLHELAGLPLHERAPFIGWLPPVLSHSQADLRAAALSSLAGAHGHSAWEWLVEGLRDPEESVRLAALDALHASCRHDGERWVHALFHRDPAIRRASIDTSRNFPLDWHWKLYLLPDEACRDLLRAELDRQGATREVLPLLVGCMREGMFTADDVRHWTQGLRWNAWLFFLAPLLPRVDDPGPLLTEALHPDFPKRLPPLEQDRLTELLSLFWMDAEAPFFHTLATGAIAEAPAFRGWLAYRLLLHGAHAGYWSATAGGLACMLWPFAHTCLWLPKAVKMEGLRMMYDAGERCPRFDGEQLAPLLGVALFWNNGVPDLWAMGALLHAFDRRPFKLLLDTVGEAAVIAGFHADYERAVGLLRVPDSSPEDRKRFIELIAEGQGHAGPRALALLAATVPADQLDFLDTLPQAALEDVHAALLAIEGAGKGMKDNKVARLADKFASRFAPTCIGPFLATWLSMPKPTTSALSMAILARLLHEGTADATIQALVALDVHRLRAILKFLPAIPGFPYERESELAQALASHPDEEVRGWGQSRTKKTEDEEALVALGSGATALLAGVCSPSVLGCVSLLASSDPIMEVAAAFVRCSSQVPEFINELDVQMVRLCRGRMELPLLGHAWLYRWDQHLKHLAGLFIARSPTLPAPRLPGFLRWAIGLPSPVLTTRLWMMASRLLDQWRWHSTSVYESQLTHDLGQVLSEALVGPDGDIALPIILAWKEKCPVSATGTLEGVRQNLALLLPKLPEAIRVRLASWVGTFAGPSLHSAVPLDEESVSMDLEALERAAASLDDRYAVPAARQLLKLGHVGAERLARALDTSLKVTWPKALLSILPGPDKVVRTAMEQLARSSLADPQTRFLVGRILWQAPDVDEVGHLIAAVCAEAPPGWLNAEDAAWLASIYPGPEKELALLLATSPHPAAHGRSIRVLAEEEPLAEDSRKALLDFLEAGTVRMRPFRVQAAEALLAAGERDAVQPVLLGEKPGDTVPFPSLLGGLSGKKLEATTRGLLAVGGEASERLLLALLDNGHDIVPTGWTEAVVPGNPARVDGISRQECLAIMLDQTRSGTVRQEVRRRLIPGQGRTHKLRTLARTFAWGVRLGRQLTGQLFDLEMIAGEELGYTRFDEQKLYITPLPILRGEEDGGEVVKGLILHEYGHHLYHKKPGDRDVWAKAQAQKIHPLLNLVSDEHLERNLRAREETYCNLIKTLDAYAFQHAAREIPVRTLLASLGSRAFQVLTNVMLHAGRTAGSVRVSAGGLLHQMDRSGLSFARFMRALRMGLGNRHGDAKVGEALALFSGARFRASTMPQMFEIALELRRIFGEETCLLDCVGQDGTMAGRGEDVVVLGDGITNDELQRAIQRALEEPRDEEPEKGNPVRAINLGSVLDFPRIDLIQPRSFDPRKYARYARAVSRQAKRLREVLIQLGLALEPKPMRVRGKTLDRSRLLPLVVKGDPRVLIARETRFRTDLFLGVVIDCSGSMSMDQNIEKAKMFAALLAEAARGLRGIDVQFWGFTDRRIFDCGDAMRPAIAELTPGEGNNDSGALYHASLVARSSRRRAKLLVMISDGSPTECTVESLRNLVRRLTARQGYLCAQVAVRPLDQITFPHFVLLQENRVDDAVKRFGQVILKLVRQALGS